MARQWGWVTSVIPVALAGLLAAGCSLGPCALENLRLRYTEVVKTTSEEQLLLNIVRLRYTDTPSSLAVSVIAVQFQQQSNLQLTPFLVAAGGDVHIRSFTSVLPQAQLLAADQPTLTLTPLDDQDFTRRLFALLPLEGVLYLAKTTWPISTVFRLYLENLNWVSNAQTASGPALQQPPEFADFLRGIEALQVLQDRGQVVFTQEERTETLSGPLPAARVTAAAVVEAAKNGQEYRPDEAGKTWTLVKKIQQPILYVHPAAVASPEMLEFVRTFHLKPGLSKYDVKVESLTPFPTTYAPEGVTTLDLETRSLLQVLYFVSQGVTVPPEHQKRELVRVTVAEDARVFDWQQVLRGLFKVSYASGQKPPRARVAVQYRGYWFYIDETDQDTLTTFSLLLELSRLELSGQTAPGPVLTLPLGGR
jgi:hypothetical protein